MTGQRQRINKRITATTTELSKRVYEEKIHLLESKDSKGTSEI
jgi:hypothetical protein